MNPRIVHGADGLNAAGWPVRAKHLITPLDLFFSRSHAAVPRIDGAAWRLEVGGLVERPRSFSLEELQRGFPRREVTASLVCAGLRRNEFLSLGPLPGELPWGPEPAGTGQWAGVALRDLLEAVGVGGSAGHVEFVGLDRVERQGHRFGFGGSIELAKGLSSEVILATALNEAPLSATHGFPLRVVVPGWIGARSVKWVGRITLLEAPSTNYFHSRAYRIQREVDPRDPRDVSAGVALTEVPLNAVFLDPTPGQAVAAGPVQVRGWAMGSGGRPLGGVEVSFNAGQDWIPAEVSAAGSSWTWRLWNAARELPPGRHTLVVRATDSTGAVQPPDVRATWNVKGYCNNAWHRVEVRAEPAADGTAP